MKNYKANSGSFKMMDISGVRSGMLVALFPVRQHYSGCGYYWRCKCDCGNESEVMATRIKRGLTKSCGCSHYKKGQNQKHGLRNHPLYRVWRSMKDRCLRPKSQNWANYGGRGIKVCNRWLQSVENFFTDMNPGYSIGLHLDRIDVNGNYEPSNCRWVTARKNCNNKRTNVYITLDGRTHTPTEWSSEIGVKANTIQSRKRKGWTDYEALFGLK